MNRPLHCRLNAASLLLAIALIGGLTPGAVAQPANPFDDASERVGQAGPIPGAPRTAPTVFREHNVTDPEYGGMVAATVLVPDGWTREGELTRTPPAYYGVALLVDVKFTAPDGRQARFLPSFNFEFDNHQPAELFSPTFNGWFNMPLPESPGAWVMEMHQLRPALGVTDLRLVSEEMDPELTGQLRQQAAPIYQQVQQSNQASGGNGRGKEYDTQATKVVLTYTENGKDLEETVLITWSYFVNYDGGQTTGGSWSIGLMRSARGPVGTDYHNDPEIMTIFQSARYNPAWEAKMANYWAEISRIKNQGARDRLASSQAAHQKRMQTMNETTDIINRGWKSRNAIQDAGYAKTIDAIHEVTPYTNTSGETVTLPSFYDHVYTDGNGGYLLNNDALYNPNTDPHFNGVSWERVEADQ